MAGTLVANTINTDTGLFSTNNAYNGIAKAWVQYNATTQTINGSFNISSVTYSATGSFIINFTTAMSTTNYCVVASGGNTANSNIAATLGNSTFNPSFLTTSVRVNYDNGSGSNVNPIFACIAILGA